MKDRDLAGLTALMTKLHNIWVKQANITNLYMILIIAILVLILWRVW